ncbi:MAG: N-acetylmuramoyl-L-alanine amidase [Lachnospiraceae bacterium]|nr:N-acetylmuramoyl-L-alanine amidase [Lachnospiraceae bacterium]
MKRIVGIVIMLCVLATAAGCGGNALRKISAAAYYQNGCEAYEKKEYAEALKEFKKALEKGLSGDFLVSSYSYMGHCLLELEDFETAEQYYKMALDTGEEPAMCYTNLGIYCRKSGDYEQAEQYYLSALEADSLYPEALTSLGVLYSVTGRAGEAVPLLEKAISLLQEPAGFYHANLAYAYAAAGRIAEAREQIALAKVRGYAQEDYERIAAYIDECEAAEGDMEISGGTSGDGQKPEPEVTQIPENKVTQAPEPTKVPTPTVTPEPTKAAEVSAGKIIAIDPGHQQKGNHGTEPVGPGASELKTKVSSGTQGVTTKVAEHQFTLELSLKLRDALTDAGYRVVMTRETADVDLSNVERAQIANRVEADIFIRVHADGAENKEANGISVLYPSGQNPYVAELSPESKKLAQSVLDALCDATGAKKRGIVERDDLAGTNWAKMPVILIEAGFMTNEEEEKKLVSAEYQALLVQGILEGVRKYFGE